MRLKNAQIISYNCKVVEKNIIIIFNLTNSRLIPELIDTLLRLITKFKHKKIYIDLSPVDKVYCSPAVPVAAILEYFQEKYSVKIILLKRSTYLHNIKFGKPYLVNENKFNTNYLDTIWKFSASNQIYKIIAGLISNIRQLQICEHGVVESCEWVLNEIMDNVLQHSKSSVGYIMAQYHKQQNNLNICIFDLGQGIYQSMKNSQYRYKTASDAIALSLEQGVTRDREIGQGNGLWGLYNIIQHNEGELSIISGYGGILIKSDKSIQNFANPIMLSYEDQSTNVAFHINLTKRVTLSEIFPGVERFNIELENMENDEGEVVYKIAEKTNGTGTRKSGEAARNELINIFEEAKRRICIDFNDISIISSSFADEFIAKTVHHFGFVNFNNIFKVINTNSDISLIIHRAVSLRLNEEMKQSANP